MMSCRASDVTLGEFGNRKNKQCVGPGDMVFSKFPVGNRKHFHCYSPSIGFPAHLKPAFYR